MPCKRCKSYLLMAFDLVDSTSDSDDDDELYAIYQRKPKNNSIMDRIKEYSDIEFKRHFRMSRKICTQIIERFRNSSFYSGIGFDSTTTSSPEKHILSFLWFAGKITTIQEVAILFQISPNKFNKNIDRILEFFKDLAPEIIKFPTTEKEKLISSKSFRKINGFPGVLGCIDITNFPICTNSSGVVTLQGICDSNKRFIDIFTGVIGTTEKSYIFEISQIRQQLSRICGENYHLLADRGYPIREYIIIPFDKFETVTDQNKIFNNKLLTTRILIKDSFELLKQRFRQLLRNDLSSVERFCKFIMACCVLHNLCVNDEESILIGNDINKNIIEQDINIEHYELENIYQIQGEKKRLHLTNYF